jgi:polygalacturonase
MLKEDGCSPAFVIPAASPAEPRPNRERFFAILPQSLRRYGNAFRLEKPMNTPRRTFTKTATLAWLAAQTGVAKESAVDTVFDVRRQGAKGDGKSDDTKAIQSAIDQAAARGGSVFLPPGIYLSSALQLRPHVALVGIPAWDYETAQDR